MRLLNPREVQYLVTRQALSRFPGACQVTTRERSRLVKLEPWEPDLRTLLARIDEEELDLQPEFQRGIAWSPSKQQRLIDTVLRGWAMPPLHLLVLAEDKLAVLDGQQRLRSLVAFVKEHLPIGKFEPADDEVWRYQGQIFPELPEGIQRRVLNYKVPSYRLYEYSADEPYELFFRLNLPTGLTQAEKRNALVGDSRQQVKTLVASAQLSGWSPEAIGFPNARLAYDDAIARMCVCIEEGTVRTSLTPAVMEKYYRHPGGFSSGTKTVALAAVSELGRGIQASPGVKLNKATLFTWLMVCARRSLRPSLSSTPLGGAIAQIEQGRFAVRRGSGRDELSNFGADAGLAAQYLDLYNDRASLRVTDVLSVMARDAVVWRLMTILDPRIGDDPALSSLMQVCKAFEKNRAELQWRLLYQLEKHADWGTL